MLKSYEEMSNKISWKFDWKLVNAFIDKKK